MYLTYQQLSVLSETSLANRSLLRAHMPGPCSCDISTLAQSFLIVMMVCVASFEYTTRFKTTTIYLSTLTTLPALITSATSLSINGPL